MSIFDDIPREEASPPHHDETAFAYLNRSGRVVASRVRQLVDEWLNHYPVNRRDALTTRFRSPIDDQHDSAFFELFLHELFLTRGYSIVAIEPKLSHTSKSPDFLVESTQGERIYLEAVITVGRSREEAAAQTRLNQALAAIDKTPSPGHFLDLIVHGVPAKPVSTKKMTRELEKWIACLPNDEKAEYTAPFVYEEHEARITPVAFRRYNRERAKRAIGVMHFPAQQVRPAENIRAALEKKASRYGTLDHPYVVALNVLVLFQH